jgi:hypothetical protein
MAGTVAPNIVTDGLVLYLDAANVKSYPGSGTVWRDIVGTNNGTLTNGPTFDSGNGGSIVFDGVDDRVNCGKIITTIPFTVSLYIKQNIPKTESNFITQDTVGNLGRLLLRTRFDNRLSFFIGGNDFISNTVINLNLWYSVSFIRSMNGNGTIYVNGIEDSSQNLNTNLITDIETTIGYFPRVPSNSFSGNISQVQIYNRALSATEVLQNYNSTKTRFGL